MSGQDTRSLDLPPTARSTREARHFVDATLTDWDLTALRDTALLLTSEVVTNSVLHARSRVHVEILRADDGVTIEVSDASVRTPIRRAQSGDATTGRGIDLLEQLASSWDVTVRSDGKTISFSLRSNTDPWAAYSNANWRQELQR